MKTILVGGEDMTFLHCTNRLTRPVGIMLMALFIVGFMASSALADTLVKFKGGIGVNPVSAITGFPAEAATDPADRNDVRGVLPGGQPWVIRELKAKVEDAGRIKVKVKGLFFAGGDVIGTTGPIVMVAATLFCGPPGSATAHNSGAVPLNPDGSFRIDTILDTVTPSPCDTPVLLVGAPNDDGGVARWFAAGIPKRESDDSDKDDDDDNGNDVEDNDDGDDDGVGETTTTDELTGIELRLRCEVRSDRSKISVDVKNVNPADGPFTAMVMSGILEATSSAQNAIGDEIEFDFDSQPDDVAEGATEISATFIDENVTATVRDAGDNVLLQGMVACEVED